MPTRPVQLPLDIGVSPFEHTIKRPVTAKGRGLHYGRDATIRLVPSAAGRGVVFVRPDLRDFEIRASWKHVARVSYATSLMRKGVLISTTEHLLSALRGLGIDNVRVELDNLEVPILDGSALPFAQLVARAGVQRQRRKRRYMVIRQRVEVADGQKRIAIEPGDGFGVTCETYYPHPLVGPQKQELMLTPPEYLESIAPARTFGFERELPMMREQGLIQGATLANAVCFGEDGILNEEGLRFPDEPCRHKLLDLVGDLALLGHAVLGKVTAKLAGHAMHIALVERIMKDPASYEIATRG